MDLRLSWVPKEMDAHWVPVVLSFDVHPVEDA